MDRLPNKFESTQWSVVVAAGHAPTEQSREALAGLCERYWYPLYAFVRSRGKDPSEAEDLTQAFFAKLLEKNYVRDANPERGRFRSFLLTSMKHFLANEHDRQTAKKRGGGRPIASIDAEAAEGRYRIEIRDNLTPERVYERRWALTVLELALARLEDQVRRSGHGGRFAILKTYLTGDATGKYSDLAASLGMTESAAKVAVHRMRLRYRELLREEIRATIDAPDRGEDEYTILLKALSP